MTVLFNFTGGGYGDGIEPYGGKRTSPPPIAFVMGGDIDRLQSQQPLQASIYEYLRTEHQNSDVIWHFRFVKYLPEHEAIDLMSEKVSPDPNEW